MRLAWNICPICQLRLSQVGWISTSRCLKAFFAVSKHCLAGDEDAKSEEQIATSCCIRGSPKDFIQVIKQQERKEQNKDS